RPLTMTDANGVTTTFAYDARQRLTARTVAGETTTYDYWPTGVIKKITAPDGSYTQYTYDDAHRLTQIADGSGNAINYTLDGAGNRTSETTHDPDGTLHRTHSRVINSFNQVYKEINAAGTAAVTTTFGYDDNSNQTSVEAPVS